MDFRKNWVGVITQSKAHPILAMVISSSAPINVDAQLQAQLQRLTAKVQLSCPLASYHGEWRRAALLSPPVIWFAKEMVCAAPNICAKFSTKKMQGDIDHNDRNGQSQKIIDHTTLERFSN